MNTREREFGLIVFKMKLSSAAFGILIQDFNVHTDFIIN